MQKEDIIRKQFSRAFQGYDIAEVDLFLDELYRELEIAERERELLELRVEYLTASLAQHGVSLGNEQAAALEAREGYIEELINEPLDEPVEGDTPAEVLIEAALTVDDLPAPEDYAAYYDAVALPSEADDYTAPEDYALPDGQAEDPQE